MAPKYVNTPYMLVTDGDYPYPARCIPEVVSEVMRTGTITTMKYLPNAKYLSRLGETTMA